MSNNRLRTMLIISLTINVFLLGSIGGAAFMWLRTPRPIPDVQGETGAGRLRLAGAKLAPEHRQAFREALRQTRKASFGLIEQSRKNRSQAALLLTQPVPDESAVNAALARASNADLELRRRLEQRAVSFAITLPSDERTALAEGLGQRRSGRKARAQ